MPENRKIEFWSSVECGGFLRGLVRELNAAGWEVCHRFVVNERDYRAARDPVARWRTRWRAYISYPVLLRQRLRDEPPPAALVVCTNTFYAPAVAMKVAARFQPQLPIVHWVYDLFPDVLVQAGEIEAGGRLARRLERNTRFTFAHAAANVFLGEQLRAHAETRYGAIPRSVVVPVGADGRPFRNSSPGPRPESEPLRILYCGNCGRMHDTLTISAVLAQGLPVGCALDFRGYGTGYAELARRSMDPAGRRDRITFGPALPDREWETAMRRADIALVTLQKEAGALVMPSKTYSAMAAGQAILAICSPGSDLGRTVLQHDAGWVVEPEDVSGLTEIMLHLVSDRPAVLEKRVNAFRAAHDLYDEGAIARSWSELLSAVVTGVSSRLAGVS